MTEKHSVPDFVKALFQKLNLPAEGRAYVESCITNGPARDVSGRRGNVLTKFNSRKTGRMHMLESRTGEFAAALIRERDPKVRAFYPQPMPITLTPKNADGVARTRMRYTPDLLDVLDNEFVVTEVRDESALADRMAKNPYQFYLDDKGNWHFRAAEDFFSAMGLRYQLVANRQLPKNVALNARFLEDYLLENAPTADTDEVHRLQTLVLRNRFITVRELLDEHNFVADTLFKAVADEAVYFDVARDRLDIPDQAYIYSDEATSEAHHYVTQAEEQAPLPIAGQTFLQAGSSFTLADRTYTVMLCGEREIQTRNDKGQFATFSIDTIVHLNGQGLIKGEGFTVATQVKQLADVSEHELERALARLEAIKQDEQGPLSERTLSRSRSKVAQAATDLDALLALVDGERRKGNRLERLDEQAEKLAEESIDTKYNDPRACTRIGAYRDYVTACHEWEKKEGAQCIPMSYSTFAKRCNEKHSVLKRRGKRAAYQNSIIVQAVDNEFPVHGVRPYEILYIDHTNINLATIGPDGSDLGKPWLSVGLDANTTKVGAFILMYDPPSSWTVLLLLREYVRRHNRLPRAISVDNGKEFHGRALERFCKLYGVDIRYRPPAMPRGGSPVERIFGATEEEVIAQMEGNTRQLKHARETSKSHDPFERAAWTLYATYRAFEKYFFEVRPVRSHPMLGMTPNEYEAKRLAETGQREHRLVAYDQNLMLATCLPTPRGKHKFDKRRGIQSDGQWYRHPDMAVLKDGEKVEVLLEPWLFNVIYVYVRDHWVAAVGTSSRAAPGRSRREVNIAVRAEKRLALKNAAKDRLKPENLRSISALLKPESFDERLNKQQRELRHLFSRLGATTTALEVPADLLEQSDKAASKVAAALEKTAPTTAASGTPKTDNGPETAPSSAQDQALVELDGFEDNSEYEEMEDVEGTF